MQHVAAHVHVVPTHFPIFASVQHMSHAQQRDSLSKNILFQPVMSDPMKKVGGECSQK